MGHGSVEHADVVVIGSGFGGSVAALRLSQKGYRVVGFDGEVFGHPGLYVADGSIVPVSLAVNPSLTITALSEYVMSQMPTAAAAKPA